MSDYVIRGKEVISQDTRNTIAKRYHTITLAINREFRNLQNDTIYSLYVGSYGRGTAINVSDIDILVELPEAEYGRFDTQKGNGQSRLLQVAKNAIQTTYSQSDVRADGQVVKIAFSDGIQFEVLPAFKNTDGTYKYPDTNMGGKWRSTSPKTEQEAMKLKNDISNGLLYDTCRHFRRIRNDYYTSYYLSGIVIDSFVYAAIKDWHWLINGETSSAKLGDYENVLLNYLNTKIAGSPHLTTPGSNNFVDTSSSISCLEKVMRYIAE
jgi:predicted nucleotidyltransferase